TSCALFGSIMYTFARKRMLQNIQVAQLTYSSGSISLLKWLCQLTQVAQSAYSSGFVRLLKWLNQRVQPSE
ncbi:hypothetical protein NND09_08675, partial [Prevotella copri]